MKSETEVRAARDALMNLVKTDKDSEKDAVKFALGHALMLTWVIGDTPEPGTERLLQRIDDLMKWATQVGLEQQN